MFHVHGLAYRYTVSNMRGLRHCLFYTKGNAKASIRGISKKVVPALFYMLLGKRNIY